MAVPQPIDRAPRPSSLADVLDLILDKGLVIDAYVRLAVMGIEVVVVDARVVVASVDTYLRFAEAVNRLDLSNNKDSGTFTDLAGDAGKRIGERRAARAMERVKDRVRAG